MTSANQRELGRLRTLVVLFLTGNIVATVSQLADAQIVPDNSLGAERSRLTSPGANRIEGGAIRGAALFHSFSEFNVNAGQQVYFANPAAITNILTRVTGNSASNILGTLGVAGQANLFLINPNGIVFGPDARLDVAGSFTATTADSIWLDRYEFSAANPQASSLLEISITPGLQYGRNAPERVIENQGRLAVGTRQQLSLLGGTVRHSGDLLASGGFVEVSGDRVELFGTVDTRSANGTVGTFLLDPKDVLIQASTPSSGAAISAALATNNVVLQADNDITVDDDITSVSGNDLMFFSGRSLTLTPNRRIVLNGGNLTAKINDETVIAAERDPGIAEFVMAAGSQILTNGGNLNISSGTFDQTSQINTANGIVRTASTTGNGGNLTLSALGNVTTGLLDTRSSTRGGNLSAISTGGTITTTQTLATDATTQAGNISLTAAGDINVTRSVTTNALGQAGNLSLTAGGDLNLTSNGFVRGGTPAFGTTGNIASVGALSGIITLTSGGTLVGQDVRVANIVTGSSPGEETVVKARSILLERSSILALTNSSGRSGDIQVDVAEDVVLRDSNIATNANDGTSGNAGDLTLNTQRLSISRTPGIVLPFRGVGLGTTTDQDSSGNSGNLSVNASESVEIVGDQPGAYVISPARVVADVLGTPSAAISTIAFGSGNSGDLTIHTGRLVTRDGAGIFTFPLVGQGGDLTANATEIFLQGAGGITTGTLGPQRAGNLAIAAERITLTDGAQLTAATAGTGNAGDLTLSVRQLRVLNGSAISTVTLGAGSGGGTTINNAELIEVAGTSLNGESPSSIRADSVGTGNVGRLDITADRLSISQGGEITTTTLTSDAGGDIDIKTGTLQLNDGRVNASTAGTGNAGNIEIDARSLALDRGLITATSASGEGGNIALEIADLLVLRRGSTISTTAGQGQTGGNGGNINIRSGVAVAVPRENSDITANAFEGRGGNIMISTQGLFGMQLRDRLTSLSDITASSEVGLDGSVTIDVLESDPASSLVELPSTIVDSEAQIVARCTAPTNQANSFVVTGHGGLPQDPRQFLLGETVVQDLRETVADAITQTPQTISATSQEYDSPPIVEAQAWRVNAQGGVELVAIPQAQQLLDDLNCQTLKQGEQ